LASQDKIDRIRELTDIISVIEQYFPLKRAGSNYKALCPFHSEKTPSFVVSPHKQIFHCFGCGESGDVFSFIMKMDNIDFMDAVKRLADSTGIKLDSMKPKDLKKQRTSERILALNRRATDFYQRVLNSSSGAAARKYLQKRGLDKRMIELFGIGYAPAGNKLVKSAQKEAVEDEILLKSGLAGPSSSGGLFDMFRERIVFPIQDDTGNIRGFGGRVMDDSQEPKYLNSPQSDVFEKKKLLYGFYQGKEAIKKEKYIIVLEGYMDVIAAHQFGIKNAVASLGTSLTDQHVYKLKHWVDHVIFSFDSDSAGKKATVRGGQAVIGTDISAYVCILPEGNDPEDIIRNDLKGFKKALQSAVSLIDWRIDFAILSHLDIKDETRRKVKVVKDLAEIVGKMDPIEKEEVTKKIAERLQVSESALRRELHTSTKKSFYISKNTAFTSKYNGREDRVLREILHIVLQYPEYVQKLKDVFVEKTDQNMYYDLIFSFVKEFKGNLHRFMDISDADVKNMLAELSVEDLMSPAGPAEHIDNLLDEYAKLNMERDFENIKKEINMLINQDRKVSGKKKEEYDRLKKKLKGSKGGHLA